MAKGSKAKHVGIVLAFLGVVATFLDTSPYTLQSAAVAINDRSLKNKNRSIAPLTEYSQNEIERAAKVLDGYVPRVMIFDGDRFSVYNVIDASMDPDNYKTSHFCSRCIRNVPLFVNAFDTVFPERFAPGSQPFQVMYAEGDCVKSKCINEPKHKDCQGLPPILASASTPTNNEMESVITYPNWFYTSCIYDWHLGGKKSESCFWKEHEGLFDDDGEAPLDYDELIPTIIWRGSDHMFVPFIDEYKQANSQRCGFSILNETTHYEVENGGVMSPEQAYQLMAQKEHSFPPRWKGVIKTLGAQMYNMEPWIDTKFTRPSHEALIAVYSRFELLGINVVDEGMSPKEMSRYKYQIDYGGGGGTTWRGTLTKLKFPGVLFHHETRMKDWFYPLMEPYVHYIPVKWDLSDLREKYEWAEAHPELCRNISKKATELVDYILSPAYIEQLHHELYNESLAPVVEAYRPSAKEQSLAPGEETRNWILRQYQRDGFLTEKVAECNAKMCTMRSAEGWHSRSSHV